MSLIGSFTTYTAGAAASGTNVRTDLDAIKTVVNGSIDATNLADNAATTTKIASNAVATAKIQDNAVTTAKIATGAVTADKIADGALTAAKIPSGTLTGDHFQTAGMVLGTGTDGTKSGAIRGIFKSVTISSAGAATNITHNLGVNTVFAAIPCSTGTNSGSFYGLATVNSNTVSVKATQTGTRILWLLY